MKNKIILGTIFSVVLISYVGIFLINIKIIKTNIEIIKTNIEKN